MFIFPWKTDAPIYHGPWATIALIVINTVVFCQTFSFFDPDAIEPWMLHFGQGLRPAEWLSSMFIHGDIMHLVGNMVFLWAFGLVVEGKIGWYRFLAVYLGMGLVANAVEQIVMLGASEGGSFGASGVIFGLMAMALVWAPKNDLSCIYFITFRPREIDVSILNFGLLFIGIQLFFAWWGGFRISSEMLHLEGVTFGLVVGVVMLKANWVDCENWDIFAVIAGREGHAPARTVVEEAPRREDPQANALSIESFRQLIAAGRGRVALGMHDKLAATRPDWQLAQRDMLALVDALHKEGARAESIPVLVEFVRRFPEHAARPRLKLAHILIQQNRPAQAQRVLDKLPTGALPADIEKIRARLEAEATRLRDEGAMELEAQDW